MSDSFDLRRPAGLVAAAIGPPGQRVFYLQAVEGATVMTLRLEKQQVKLLADYLETVLSSTTGDDHGLEVMPEFLDNAPVDWVIGSLLVAVTEDESRIVIVAEELIDDLDGAGRSARVALTPEQVAGFIDGGRHVVSQGRPECPLCGAPMDPSGHGCPRLN